MLFHTVSVVTCKTNQNKTSSTKASLSSEVPGGSTWEVIDSKTALGNKAATVIREHEVKRKINTIKRFT